MAGFFNIQTTAPNAGGRYQIAITSFSIHAKQMIIKILLQD